MMICATCVTQEYRYVICGRSLKQKARKMRRLAPLLQIAFGDAEFQICLKDIHRANASASGSRSLFSSVVVVAGLLQHGLSTPDPVLRTSHGLCKLSYTLKYCDGHKASQIGTELQLRTEKLFQLAILQHKGRICI